jgi:two-component system, LytTR family, response regulator LytT
MTKNSLQIGKRNITVGDQYKDAFNQFVNKWT